MPQTFMNASGRAVQMLAGFFKIPPEEILVVHDELDFAPGTARLKQGGGIAGHNGLKDISQRLGTHDYWRLRIGVGRPTGDSGADYVLEKPPAEEREGYQTPGPEAHSIVAGAGMPPPELHRRVDEEPEERDGQLHEQNEKRHRFRNRPEPFHGRLPTLPLSFCAKRRISNGADWQD